MAPDRRKALEQLRKKVKALYRLQRRAATDGEAQAAAFALGKLLTKHQIDISSLETSEDEERPVLDAVPLATMRGATTWRIRLAAAICDHCGVSAWVARSTRTKATRFMLCGRPTDIEAVRGMYSWLTAEAQRLCVASGHKGSHANDWLRGFSLGLAEQLLAAKKDAIGEACRESPGSSVAIVLASKQNEADELMQSTFGSMKAHVLRRRRVCGSVHAEGRANGRSIHLGKSLANSEQTPPALRLGT